MTNVTRAKHKGDTATTGLWDKKGYEITIDGEIILVHGPCSPASLDYKTGAGVLNSRAKSGLPNPFSQAEMASANEMRRPWSISDIHFSSFQLIGIYHSISPYKTHIKLQKFLSKRCTVFQSFIYFVVSISRIFGDAKHWLGKKIEQHPGCYICYTWYLINFQIPTFLLGHWAACAMADANDRQCPGHSSGNVGWFGYSNNKNHHW